MLLNSSELHTAAILVVKGKGVNGSIVPVHGVVVNT